jgi:Protein of unknown function (DUF3037)
MVDNIPLPEEELREFVYRVIRYTPNVVRDEWVNIGVILDGPASSAAAGAGVAAGAPAGESRRQARLVETDGEMARVRRLHPAADIALLRSLGPEFEARLSANGNGSGNGKAGGGEEKAKGAAEYLKRLEDSLSNALQFSPQKAVLAGDFDLELERLYQAHVSPPRGARGGLIENTRAWIHARLRDVFLRRKLNAKSSWQKSVPVEEFTQPGDPLKIDYAYRSNGTRGFIEAISLWRDPAQAKVLAYTAECIRARVPKSEFTAVVEMEPARENPRHQFVARLFEDQKIALVPLNRIEKFAEELRVRVN